MGNFYTNYTLKGPGQHAVAIALTGRRAKVTPPLNGCVVAFDEDSESQDDSIISDLASRLSLEFLCPVLAVINHDDDILWYQLYRSGSLIDEYNSAPGFFDSSIGDLLPSGGDANVLCRVFGVGDIARVERILHASATDEDGYAFAFQRHAELARAIDIPAYAVGTGYTSFWYNEYPAGLSAEVMLAARCASALT